MNRVMLIEDEPPILNMVKEMIEASPQGFAVTHTAYNGKNALKLLEPGDILPDLIVTDIRMPMMDGLQFMKELAARGYDIPCIVLSGYGDFEYARAALQSHACDYLLKPLKEDHLEETLAKASALICKRKTAGQRAYLKKVLRLPDDSGALLSDPGYPAYQLLLVRGGAHRNAGWEDVPFVSRSFEALERTPFPSGASGSELPVWWIGGMTSNEKIAIRALSDPAQQSLRREEAESLLCAWQGAAEADFAPALCAAVSEPIPGVRLSSTLRELRETLASETIIGESRVWLPGDRISPAFVITAELEQACRAIVKTGGYRAFEKAFQGWKDEWLKEGYGQLAVENLLEAIVQAFRTQWPVPGRPVVGCFDANGLVSGCRSLDEAAAQFLAYMKEEFESLASSRADRSAKELILNVRRYLEEHYMEPIGSDKLQEMFGFNRTYISNVFSDVVGIPPGKFLAKLRIEKAIALLRERPELTLRQVSEQVGYEDSLYFSKVFKNAVGMSPKEYRERRERDGEIERK